MRSFLESYKIHIELIEKTRSTRENSPDLAAKRPNFLETSRFTGKFEIVARRRLDPNTFKKIALFTATQQPPT